MPSRLDPLEAEISARVRRWRRGADLSQTDLATSIGISRDLLAAYEGGRSAFPWRLYQKLALKHRVNPEWLYSGSGAPEDEFDLRVLEAVWPPKARFTRAWGRDRRPVPPTPSSSIAPATRQEIDAHLDRLWSDAILQSPLLSGLPPGAAEEHFKRWALRRAKGPNLSLKADKPDWKTLLTQLRKHTAKRGAPSALARELGVDRQRITDWLQGKTTPDAATTLKLWQKLRATE
jgi:transcriptional regulator with XRE-family HTH domain